MDSGVCGCVWFVEVSIGHPGSPQMACFLLFEIPSRACIKPSSASGSWTSGSSWEVAHLEFTKGRASLGTLQLWHKCAHTRPHLHHPMTTPTRGHAQIATPSNHHVTQRSLPSKTPPLIGSTPCSRMHPRKFGLAQEGWAPQILGHASKEGGV